MTMPFRQKLPDCVAPCGTHELKQVDNGDGTYKTIVDDTKLPDSAQFETKNMLAAKISLTDSRFAEVSSEITTSIKDVEEPEIEDDKEN